MAKMRLVIEIDDNDMGPIVRLMGEGKLKIRDNKTIEENPGADETIKKFRREQKNGSSHHHPHNGPHKSRPGERAIEYVINIMQEKPDSTWHVDDIGVALEYWEKSRTTASPSLSVLKRNGYVDQVDLGKYVLTKLGKSHPQNDPLPFNTTEES